MGILKKAPMAVRAVNRDIKTISLTDSFNYFILLITIGIILSPEKIVKQKFKNLLTYMLVYVYTVHRRYIQQ